MINRTTTHHPKPCVKRNSTERLIKRYKLTDEQHNVLVECCDPEIVRKLDAESLKYLLALHIRRINRALLKLELDKECTSDMVSIIEQEKILNEIRKSLTYTAIEKNPNVLRMALTRLITKELPNANFLPKKREATYLQL